MLQPKDALYAQTVLQEQFHLHAVYQWDAVAFTAAVGVEQTFLGGEERAHTIAFDGAAFELEIECIDVAAF